MILLSHNISSEAPVYGGGEPVKMEPVKCLSQGDSCNTLQVSFSNHSGTHLDCPAHFDPGGKTLTDYPPEFWHCREVQVLTLALADAQICSVKDLSGALEDCSRINYDAEILLLDTGWHQKRNQEQYWKAPPGFDPGLANFLRKKFPQIRFFGFDVISLSSFTNRELGREAHRAFLNRPDPILILEDMNFASFKPEFSLSRVIISPLFLEGADGSPCTVWGFME